MNNDFHNVILIFILTNESVPEVRLPGSGGKV
jgi:hypothetical protein